METAPRLQLAMAAPVPALAVTPAVMNEPQPNAALEISTPNPARSDHHNAQAAARILAASATRHASERRRNLIGLISLGGILVVALGSYYYYATLAQTTPYLGMSPLPVAAEENATEPTADASGAAQSILLDSPPPAQTPWQDGLPPIAPKITQDWEPAPVDPRVLRGEQPLPIAEADVTAETAAPTASIRITRGTQPDRVSVDLQTAYQDFQAGRLAQAETNYRQALTRDAHNRDARMGLAAIAVRSGLLDSARAQYQAVLQRNPKDLAAHAALADLDQDHNTNTESQLKSLLAEQPQSAQLHFALANIYAEQRRWPYAQQAYFEAQRLAPEHPDYAFNLAVSLEHLGQSRTALEYYRRAIQLAGQQHAQFDLRAAQQRVAVLTAQARS
jgi:tetratricopeptide (TPR) repeat protein